MDIVERLKASSIRNPITMSVITDRSEAAYLMDEAATEITQRRQQVEVMRVAIQQALDHCQRLRNGSDDWFDLVEIQAMLLPAIANVKEVG